MLLKFFRYLKLALDFKKRAFLSEKEKFEETVKIKERMDVVSFEIEKTNRFLNILTNTVPDEKENCESFANECLYSETDKKFDIEK